MLAKLPRRPLTRLIDWAKRRPGKALAWYWPVAFITTHIPRLGPPPPVPPPDKPPYDKVVHFGSFVILGWLLMALLTRRLPAWAAVGLVLLICGAYGVIDELTQPPFRRTADVWDWYADIAGALCGLLLFIMIRARKSVGIHDEYSRR